MSNTGKIRFLCQNETRLGLKTISGRKITADGEEPKPMVSTIGVVGQQRGPGTLEEAVIVTGKQIGRAHV